MGIVSEPDNPYLCRRNKPYLRMHKNLTNETNIPEYNEVVFCLYCLFRTWQGLLCLLTPMLVNGVTIV